jgi:large subunit ribosomal protein L4
VGKLAKYNIQGKEVGSVNIDDAQIQTLLDKAADHSQSIKDYIVAIRNNARQWSANTKRRSDMTATRRKPFPQKGQGRSRHGSWVEPSMRGGAVAWGPQSKEMLDVWVRINRKEKRAAIAILMAEKVKGDQNGSRVRFLEKSDMKEPKTKVMADFLDKIALRERRVLVIGNEPEVNLVKSLRNIPKKEFIPFSQVNGYELVKAQQIIVLESALDEFNALLGQQQKAK